ncbi:putative tryptophan transport protein [Paraliobacillus quinghaiensis]|uniref:Tryptophan transport protein n=1 Tax=Paraliobacillus quinghaiensis TaxID=470815 RepID=A0A917TLN1_9BACI|nr:tryptophan transporter [Paraliobacillus quinghaiensis]GGM25461.1 putative tryptophan transport protein [Paraliobacillus quinghaiensis]
MKTKVLILLSLFISIGAVLHIVAPPIFGVKPDIMLTMMFLGILLFPKIQYVFLLAMSTGIISALTTNAPGGQISNLVDKPITAFIFFGLLFLIPNKLNKNIAAPILVAIGTAVSGSVFLFMAIYVVGLMPGTFTGLFLAIVLPTIAINTALTFVLYPILQNIMKRSQITTA